MRRLSLAAAIALAYSLHAQPPMRLTLADAQRLAIQNNPLLSAASYNAAAAYQVPKEYQANLAPSMLGSFTSVGADNGSRLAAGGLNNPVVYNRVGSGLTAGQIITDFGRTANLVGMARLRAQAQDETTATTRARILLETSRAYFAVLRTQAVLKVADQTVQTRQLVADRIGALAENQERSNLDVSFANVNLSEARLLQIQAQNDVMAAQAELANAMGLPNQTAFELAEDPLPEPLPDRVSDLIAQAVRNRPELKDLRLRQSAAERLAKSEHDLYYPSVAVVGSAGFVPTGYAAVPGRYGAIGLNVTIPIFNGGLFRARQTEAEMHSRAAAGDAAGMENQVVRDVRLAYLSATAAYDRMALTRQLLDQARMGLDLAQSRYDLGLSAIVELSQAQLNLTTAEIANTAAKYDYQTRMVEASYQIGTLR